MANALGLVVLVIVGLVVYLLLVGGLLAVVGHVSRGADGPPCGGTTIATPELAVDLFAGG